VEREIERSRRMPGLGNGGRRRKEDGEAKEAQSALAVLLGNSGVLVLYWSDLPQSKELYKV